MPSNVAGTSVSWEALLDARGWEVPQVTVGRPASTVLSGASWADRAAAEAEAE